MTPLGTLVAERIAAQGPMRLDAYMALCLGHPEHGYYMRRDPLGRGGDFITAPEISQMFGELIGAWMAAVWAEQGAPDRFVLAELGPGRGTLMQDALRATAALPGFEAAADLWLVETSPLLRARQAERLARHAPRWAAGLGDLPAGPLIVIANEFFDALPIRQFQRIGPFWRERLVGPGLAFLWGRPEGDAGLDARFPLAPDGAIVEVNGPAEALAGALAARIGAAGGAALILDYGAWDGTGDTLQALRGHAPADPLAEPGLADLTAHVRFKALAEAAAGHVRASGALTQGQLLERLGIAARARALARGKSPAEAAGVAAAYRRLTHAEEMGQLFQALAFTPLGLPPPPGFDA